MKTLTDIEGVFASGMHCGIKPEKPDLAFIYVPNAVASAAVFTKNNFVAPSITTNREAHQKATTQLVIVNSGNANAGTGKQGADAVSATVQKAAALTGLHPDSILIGSTGIIGTHLPMEKLTRGLDILLATPKAKNGTLAAQAILTTDLVPKSAFLEADVDGVTIQVAGIAKGSGMIAPNMATTLAFWATNVAITSADLQAQFLEAIDQSFNMISVDTDTSPNDMGVIMATGAVVLDSEGKKRVFRELLNEATLALALMIVKDGEGATKIIECQVTGAASVHEARKIAKLVIDSPLVKTAMHGEDPNWGRIVAAACKDPSLTIDPLQLELRIGGDETTLIFKNGEPVPTDRAKLKSSLMGDRIVITLALFRGSSTATAWGCDLTKRYIDINVSYS